jgi:hypothetical protein
VLTLAAARANQEQTQQVQLCEFGPPQMTERDSGGGPPAAGGASGGADQHELPAETSSGGTVQPAAAPAQEPAVPAPGTPTASSSPRAPWDPPSSSLQPGSPQHRWPPQLRPASSAPSDGELSPVSPARSAVYRTATTPALRSPFHAALAEATARRTTESDEGTPQPRPPQFGSPLDGSFGDGLLDGFRARLRADSTSGQQEHAPQQQSGPHPDQQGQQQEQGLQQPPPPPQQQPRQQSWPGQQLRGGSADGSSANDSQDERSPDVPPAPPGMSS